MSITAVPLHPVAKGSLTRLWLGVAALALGFVTAQQFDDWVNPRKMLG